MNIRIRLVDLRRLRQLLVSLQTPRLVRTVLENDIPLLVLIVPQAEQDDVALVYPHFFPQLASDVGEAFFAVEAEGFQAAVAQHFEHLGVFLPFFLEGQFALFVVVFVFAAASIFASLFFGRLVGGWGRRGDE